MYEADLKGNVGNKIGDDVEIKAGGISTISFSTAKPAILFKSASSNVNNSVVNLDAQFLGRAFYGQLDVAENLKNKSFDGININGTNLGTEIDEGSSNDSPAEPSKIQLTITLANKSITYGDDAPEYTATYSEEVDPADITGTLQISCSYVKGNGAGSYDITASGVTSDKYDITIVPGKLTVGKRDLKLKAHSNIESVEIGYNSITFDTQLVSESGNEFVGSDSLSSLGGSPVYHLYVNSGTYQNPQLGEEITDLDHVVHSNIVSTLEGYTSDNYNLIYVLSPAYNQVI